jgi:hypothetical protein
MESESAAFFTQFAERAQLWFEFVRRLLGVSKKIQLLSPIPPDLRMSPGFSPKVRINPVFHVKGVINGQDFS